MSHLTTCFSYHRVDLFQLCGRINLDTSISVMYPCTTEQLAEMLTKCPFTTTQETCLMRLVDRRPRNICVSMIAVVLQFSCAAVSKISFLRHVVNKELAASLRVGALG